MGKLLHPCHPSGPSGAHRHVSSPGPCCQAEFVAREGDSPTIKKGTPQPGLDA